MKVLQQQQVMQNNMMPALSSLPSMLAALLPSSDDAAKGRLSEPIAMSFILSRIIENLFEALPILALLTVLAPASASTNILLLLSTVLEWTMVCFVSVLISEGIGRFVLAFLYVHTSAAPPPSPANHNNNNAAARTSTPKTTTMGGWVAEMVSRTTTHATVTNDGAGGKCNNNNKQPTATEAPKKEKQQQPTATAATVNEEEIAAEEEGEEAKKETPNTPDSARSEAPTEADVI